MYVSGYDDILFGISDNTVQACYGLDGRLTRLGSITPKVTEPYATLVARDHRAFLSGYGVMEVITSASEQPLESAVHDLRSYSCSNSSLEVVGDQALCAMGMYGVQSIPLD
jgi:hypothetical protein